MSDQDTAVALDISAHRHSAPRTVDVAGLLDSLQTPVIRVAALGLNNGQQPLPPAAAI